MMKNMLSAAEIIAICEELDNLYEEYDANEAWFSCSTSGIKAEEELDKKIDDLRRILEEYENG